MEEYKLYIWSVFDFAFWIIPSKWVIGGGALNSEYFSWEESPKIFQTEGFSD